MRDESERRSLSLHPFISHLEAACGEGSGEGHDGFEVLEMGDFRGKDQGFCFVLMGQ